MRSTPNATVHADIAVNHDSHLRRWLTPAPLFELAGPTDATRAEAESLVAEKFAGTWQARVTHFLPWLLSMHCLGLCTAVAGMRPAINGALFLEQYLPAPVENLMTPIAGETVSRDAIVEIGNLAATQRGASRLLFLVMTAALHEAGYRWIVFTATKNLRNNLGKLGFPIHHLADATPNHLDAEALAVWGRYYDSEPQVMAGNLDQALRLIEQRPLLLRLLRLYRRRITALADILRSQ